MIINKTITGTGVAHRLIFRDTDLFSFQMLAHKAMRVGHALNGVEIRAKLIRGGTVHTDVAEYVMVDVGKVAVA